MEVSFLYGVQTGSEPSFIINEYQRLFARGVKLNYTVTSPTRLGGNSVA
jgi:hypothetical protein